MARKKVNKKDDFNILHYRKHGLSTPEWIKRCFEIQTTPDGKPIVLPAKPIIDENGILRKQRKYKIKRHAELWMIALVAIMDIEYNTRYKAHRNKKQIDSFAFYGSYKLIRNLILNSVDERLVPQLSQSITFNTINTAMKRAEKSGFIKIEYDDTVNRENCSREKNYRRITLNYDKLVELCDFNLDKHKWCSSDIWKKYHHSSREHKFIRKRPVSYCKKLIDDLTDDKRKNEFKAKLAKLKLKYKNHHDILKAFINTKQKKYSVNNEYSTKYLTTIKSEADDQAEMMRLMYQKPKPSECVVTESQVELLKSFIDNIR